MKICFTKKTKQNKSPPAPPPKKKPKDKKKRKESFHWRESNPGPPTYKVNALSMKFCGSTLFEAGIAGIYEELKDIFEENKHGFDS